MAVCCEAIKGVFVEKTYAFSVWCSPRGSIKAPHIAPHMTFSSRCSGVKWTCAQLIKSAKQRLLEAAHDAAGGGFGLGTVSFHPPVRPGSAK